MPTLTPQYKLDAIAEELKAGGKRDTIAVKYGVSHGTVDKVRKSLGEPAAAPERLITTETNEVVGDQWTITLPKTRISSLEELLEHCKVDQRVWAVERWVCNAYQMGVGTGPADKREVIVQPLYQVKATLRRKVNVALAIEEIERLKAEAVAYMPVIRPVVHTTQRSQNLLELLLPDLHLGKLAHSRETGGPNYDLKIAEEVYRRAVDTLLSRVRHYNLDRIVLGVGNDLLQADNSKGTTWSGTQVDTDSRYCKVYTTARKMLTDTIEQLRQIAPVDVKMVPGNHDTASTFCLGDSLFCWFSRYSDVHVDNEPTMHKIVEWGDVFLALIHGHLGKRADFGIWMASTFPEIFGRTKFREIHTGHRHQSALEEKYGIRVRTFASLSAADEWHASNLLTGNLRTAEALVFNKTEGLVGQFYHTEV